MTTTTYEPPTASLLTALRQNLQVLGELALRYEVDTQPPGAPADLPAITGPADVQQLVGPELAPLVQEQLRVLLLNTKHRVIGQRVIYQGTVDAAGLRAAEVFRPAIIAAAPCLIVVHNHPSGRPHAQPRGRRRHQGAGGGCAAPGYRTARPPRDRWRPGRELARAGPAAQRKLVRCPSQQGKEYEHDQQHAPRPHQPPPTPPRCTPITAGGFTATADAFARDPATEGLWFLSMVGAQTALKAIWAALLKQPPAAAYLLPGAEGTALSGGFQQCVIPAHTVGTWTTKLTRLPVCGGWHALVYTTLAEYATEREQFLLLAPHEAEAPALHHRFLDRRSPLPCTTPGRPGSGSAASPRKRSRRCKPPASSPTTAGPTPRPSRPTWPTPSPPARSRWTSRQRTSHQQSPRPPKMRKEQHHASSRPGQRRVLSHPTARARPPRHPAAPPAPPPRRRARHRPPARSLLRGRGRPGAVGHSPAPRQRAAPRNLRRGAAPGAVRPGHRPAGPHPGHRPLRRRHRQPRLRPAAPQSPL